MKVCSNYFKILLVILLISIIFYLSNKIKEKFISIGKCNVDKDCDKVPKAIQLMVNTNNSKNIIKLTWKKQTDVGDYYIMMYKNNLGPYIIKPIIDPNDNEYVYNFLNPETNLKYKFAVIGNNDYGIGYINNFTEAILTPEGLELKYLQNVKSNIVCNADGSFKITDKCISNEEVDAKIIDNNIERDFDNASHVHLMEQLNKNIVLKFNL
jgi:hypothetical protein